LTSFDVLFATIQYVEGSHRTPFSSWRERWDTVDPGRAQLDKIPNDERVFYFMAGQLANDVNALQKLLLFAINQHLAPEELQVGPLTETDDDGDGSNVPSLPTMSWKVSDSGTLAKPLVVSRVKLTRMGTGGTPFGTN
jgi:hypothetical protein